VRVLHTLADANFLGYDTILMEDCAATANPDFCREATLLNIRQILASPLPQPRLMKVCRHDANPLDRETRGGPSGLPHRSR
jgi:hypothetical protein